MKTKKIAEKNIKKLDCYPTSNPYSTRNQIKRGDITNLFGNYSGTKFSKQLK